MGILGGLSRLIKGEPVFQTGADSHPAGNDQPVLPVARITRTETSLHGDDMTVYGTIKNESDVVLTLDKIRLIDGVQELDYALSPGQSREFKLYDGDCRADNRADSAYLIYKDETGDYFQAEHYIEYRFDADNKLYHVDEFKLLKAVRDI